MLDWIINQLERIENKKMRRELRRNPPQRSPDGPPPWTDKLMAEIWDAGLYSANIGTGFALIDPMPRKAMSVVLDWLEHLDERIEGPSTRWDDVVRHHLAWALNNPTAKGTKALDLLVAQFHRNPQISEHTAFSAGQVIRKLAAPEDFERIADIARMREHGGARSELLLWIGASRRKAALGVLVGELDDPSVAHDIMRVLRRKKLPPGLWAEIRPHAVRYLDPSASEYTNTREEARRLLDVCEPGPGSR